MSVTGLMTKDTRFTIGHSAYRVTCLSGDEYSAPVSRHTSHQIKCTSLDGWSVLTLSVDRTIFHQMNLYLYQSELETIGVKFSIQDQVTLLLRAKMVKFQRPHIHFETFINLNEKMYHCLHTRESKTIAWVLSKWGDILPSEILSCFF